MIRCLMLVEGQTEKAFVNRVLVPHLATHSIHCRPRTIETSTSRSGHQHQGGLISFAQLERNLKPLLASGDAVVTTMVDYFRLPNETPGVADRMRFARAPDRARHISRAIEAHFHHPRRFHAYLSLHEFEALVLAAPESLAEVLGDLRLLDSLAAIVTSHDPPEPETINEGPATAPAARIRRVAPRFRKLHDGPAALQRAGLPRIRAACPHFDAWVTLLESYGTPPSPPP